jgi:hypothetical protein
MFGNDSHSDARDRIDAAALTDARLAVPGSSDRVPVAGGGHHDRPT